MTLQQRGAKYSQEPVLHGLSKHHVFLQGLLLIKIWPTFLCKMYHKQQNSLAPDLQFVKVYSSVHPSVEEKHHPPTNSAVTLGTPWRLPQTPCSLRRKCTRGGTLLVRADTARYLPVWVRERFRDLLAPIRVHSAQ